MRGSRMMARAMAVRCFWPPERVKPRSPTIGVEAAGKLEDLGADVGDGGGVFDLFGGGFGAAEGDVLADGFGEEEGLLRDEADAFAERRTG